VAEDQNPEMLLIIIYRKNILVQLNGDRTEVTQMVGNGKLGSLEQPVEPPTSIRGQVIYVNIYIINPFSSPKFRLGIP